MSYNFPYYNFSSRFWNLLTLYLAIVSVTFLVLFLVSNNSPYLYLLLYLTLVAFLVLQGVKQCKYYIQTLELNDSTIHLRIYEFDKLIVDNSFHLNDISMNIVLASSSVRGNIYKLIIIINKNLIIAQYENLFWRKNNFDEILKTYKANTSIKSSVDIQ